MVQRGSAGFSLHHSLPVRAERERLGETLCGHRSSLGVGRTSAADRRARHKPAPFQSRLKPALQRRTLSGEPWLSPAERENRGIHQPVIEQRINNAIEWISGREIHMRLRGSADLLEDRRRRALGLLDDGLSLNEVGRRIGCAASSVMHWRDARRRFGDAGLVVRSSPGRPRRLSRKDERRLIRILLKGAVANGYKSELWTALRIAEVIKHAVRRCLSPQPCQSIDAWTRLESSETRAESGRTRRERDRAVEEA